MEFYSQVTAYLGMEDDILVNLVMAELEKENEPDPRRIQINLTGFLDRNAASFVAELWNLLLSAQENHLPGQKGIPTELLKEKIIEIDKLNQVTLINYTDYFFGLMTNNLSRSYAIVRKKSQMIRNAGQKMRLPRPDMIQRRKRTVK